MIITVLFRSAFARCSIPLSPMLLLLMSNEMSVYESNHKMEERNTDKDTTELFFNSSAINCIAWSPS